MTGKMTGNLAEKPLPKGYKTKPFVNQARQEWIQVKESFILDG